MCYKSRAEIWPFYPDELAPESTTMARKLELPGALNLHDDVPAELILDTLAAGDKVLDRERQLELCAHSSD